MALKRVIGIIAAICTLLAVNAQEHTFTASAPASVQAGQQFQYTVQGNEQAKVMLPELSEFELLAGPFSSFSTSTQWINGKMSAQTTATYTYVLRAGSPGDYTIPPSQVRVKKENIETNPVRISVVGASQGGASTNPGVPSGNPENQNAQRTQASGEQAVFLRVLPSKKSMYLGEQFVSELKVYTSVNTRPTAGLKEIPYEGFYKQTLDPDQTSSRETINGKVHVTQVLQRHVLIPQKTGKLVIEPFESEWAIPQRVQSQRSRNIFDDFFDDPFSDPFFDRIQNVPVVVSTKAVTIDVKPLPPGAPEGFTGGVGDLKFSAKLSSDKVKVNDALSLVIRISGTGNLALIGAPEVNFPPDHDVYETSKSSNISTSGNRIGGTLTFEYPIVARHAGNFRIAPISFAWFDPEREEYRALTTEEFTFTVEKGEDAGNGGQVYLPGLRAEEVENIGSDILDIKRAVPGFNKLGASPLQNTFYWVAYAVLLLLFIAGIIFLRLYLRHKADIRLSRNRRANKLARKRLRTADRARKSGEHEKFYEEIEKAIWGYLSDKLSIDLSSLSREKVQTLLKTAGTDEELLGELLRIIDDCEFSRYAPSSEKSDMDVLYADAMRLIHQLEQNISVK